MWLQESRYRQRYLDTIVNGHVRDIFVTRACIIRFLRSYFDERGFLEVRMCCTHVAHTFPSLEWRASARCGVREGLKSGTAHSMQPQACPLLTVSSRGKSWCPMPPGRR